MCWNPNFCALECGLIWDGVHKGIQADMESFWVGSAYMANECHYRRGKVEKGTHRDCHMNMKMALCKPRRSLGHNPFFLALRSQLCWHLDFEPITSELWNSSSYCLSPPPPIRTAALSKQWPSNFLWVMWCKLLQKPPQVYYLIHTVFSTAE